MKADVVSIGFRRESTWLCRALHPAPVSLLALIKTKLTVREYGGYLVAQQFAVAEEQRIAIEREG